MNISIAKSIPSGEFAEISIHLPEWKATFLRLARMRKQIKYDLYSMPTIPKIVADELGKYGYYELVLESDDWQRFLVPNHG